MLFLFWIFNVFIYPYKISKKVCKPSYRWFSDLHEMKGSVFIPLGYVKKTSLKREWNSKNINFKILRNKKYLL